MQEAAVHMLTTPQRVPAKSSPGPVHPRMSPLEELLSNVENGENWPRAEGGLHCFFLEGLAAPASLGTTAQSLTCAYPRALLSELHQQVSDSTVAAVGADSQLGSKDSSLVQTWITNMVAGGQGEGSDLQRSPHANNPYFLPSVPLALPSWPSPSKWGFSQHRLPSLAQSCIIFNFP